MWCLRNIHIAFSICGRLNLRLSLHMILWLPWKIKNAENILYFFRNVSCRWLVDVTKEIASEIMKQLHTMHILLTSLVTMESAMFDKLWLLTWQKFVDIDKNQRRKKESFQSARFINTGTWYLFQVFRAKNFKLRTPDMMSFQSVCFTKRFKTLQQQANIYARCYPRHQQKCNLVSVGSCTTVNPLLGNVYDSKFHTWHTVDLPSNSW